MPASLDKLLSNLKPNQLKHTRETFGDERNLLLSKGVFPYNCFNSFEKLNETKFPPREAFYSKLNDSEISDSDYEHAQKVWDHFGLKTFRDYHELYMMLDVSLLADVFKNFRDVRMEN